MFQDGHSLPWETLQQNGHLLHGSLMQLIRASYCFVGFQESFLRYANLQYGRVVRRFGPFETWLSGSSVVRRHFFPRFELLLRDCPGADASDLVEAFRCSLPTFHVDSFRSSLLSCVCSPPQFRLCVLHALYYQWESSRTCAASARGQGTLELPALYPGRPCCALCCSKPSTDAVGCPSKRAVPSPSSRLALSAAIEKEATARLLREEKAEDRQLAFRFQEVQAFRAPSRLCPTSFGRPRCGRLAAVSEEVLQARSLPEASFVPASPTASGRAGGLFTGAVRPPL